MTEAVPACGPRRERLPPRRNCRTDLLKWTPPGGSTQPILITVGFYSDWRPGEVFATAAKSGADIRLLLEDASVLVSNLLQMGRDLDDIKCRLGGDGGGGSTSAIGAVVRFAADMADAVRREIAEVAP